MVHPLCAKIERAEAGMKNRRDTNNRLKPQSQNAGGGLAGCGQWGCRSGHETPDPKSRVSQSMIADRGRCGGQNKGRAEKQQKSQGRTGVQLLTL
jgi:hypothetical protein